MAAIIGNAENAVIAVLDADLPKDRRCVEDQGESDTLLLEKSAWDRSPGAQPLDEDQEQALFGPNWFSLFRKEAWRLFLLAGPLAVQQIVIYLTTMTTVVFVGRIGEFELSVITLTNGLFVASGQVTMMGIASVMETLCGQAFGAKNYSAIGIIFQRAMLICGVACALTVALWSQLGRILVATGQGEEIAAASVGYILKLVPALLLLGMGECAKRYLMAQNNVSPAAVVYTAGFGAALFFNWLFIQCLGLGLTGAAIALTSVQLHNFILLTAFIIWHNRRLKNTKEDPWPGWSWQALQGWGQYLKIALPSYLMLCLEWWLFEFIIVACGLLDHPELTLATMGACMNVLAVVYQPFFGMGSAASTRVANSLGAGEFWAAIRVTVVALFIVIVLSLSVASSLVLGRGHWAYIFTTETEVANLAAKIYPIAAIAHVGDAINGLMAGVVRGCGRQTIGAVMNACTFWGVGLPVALVTAFKFDMGLSGLWIGLTTAILIQAVLITCVVLRLDWKDEARRAAQNVQEGSHEENPRIPDIELQP